MIFPIIEIFLNYEDSVNIFSKCPFRPFDDKNNSLQKENDLLLFPNQIKNGNSHSKNNTDPISATSKNLNSILFFMSAKSFEE